MKQSKKPGGLALNLPPPFTPAKPPMPSARLLSYPLPQKVPDKKFVQAKRAALVTVVPKERGLPLLARFDRPAVAVGRKVLTSRAQAIQCALRASATVFTPSEIIDARPVAYRDNTAFTTYEDWVRRINNLPQGWRIIRVVRSWHTGFEEGAQVGHFNITIDGGEQLHVYYDQSTSAFYIG